jgi:hypothetical protein
MGPIVNIQGFNGNLLIHHRNAIYVTQDKTTLQGDILSVTLGSGDIFRLKPQQGKPSKTGYAGTQHQLACMLTDFGYVFPDAETGNWFVLNDKGLQEMNADMYNFFREYLNVKELNPFNGNGICVGYDGELKRILVTVKNLRLRNTSAYIPNYEETPAFIAKLTPGVSIVYKNGRYQKYMGLNTSAFNCEVYANPTVPNYTFNVNENLPASTLIGQIVGAGSGALSYFITGGNTDGAFGIDSVTGKLVVLNQSALNVLLRTQFILTTKVTDIRGQFGIGTVTVNLAAVLKPPVATDIELTVSENQTLNTLLLRVPGVDPKGLPLTWSIDSQSVAGALSINPTTGDISVANSAAFNFEVNAILEAVVRASNGSQSDPATVRIILSNVQEAPTVANQSVTITAATTGVVLTWPVIIDQDDGQTVTTTFVSASVPSAFTVDLVNRTVTRNPAYTLLASQSPYTIVLRATDSAVPALSADFTLSIIVPVVYGFVNIYNTDGTSPANYTATVNNVPVTLTEDFYIYFNNSYTSPVSIKIKPISGVGNIDHDIYSAPSDATLIQDSAITPYDTVFNPNAVYEILVNVDVNNYIEILKHTPVNVNYSIAYGLNPITQSGLIFMRNGVEIFRTGNEGSGVLTGLYYKGNTPGRGTDSIRVRQFSYGDALPWEAGSKANLAISQSTMASYNQDVTVQAIELQALTFNVVNNDINVISTGSSTATGYQTKIVTVNSDTVLAAVEITDTTVPKVVLKVNDTVNSASSVYPFNYVIDANTLTAKVINKSVTVSINVRINGGAITVIPAAGFVNFPGIVKDSLTVTITSNPAP